MRGLDLSWLLGAVLALISGCNVEPSASATNQPIEGEGASTPLDAPTEAGEPSASAARLSHVIITPGGQDAPSLPAAIILPSSRAPSANEMIIPSDRMDSASGTDAASGTGGMDEASGTGGMDPVPDAGQPRCDSLAADFSATGLNPAGAWSYGWTTRLGSSFTIATFFWTSQPDVAPGTPSLVGWSAGATIAFNPNAVAVHSGVSAGAPEGTNTIEPGQTNMHPGSNGEYAVARWTAAESGAVSLQVMFQGQSGYRGFPLTTTDVHVQHNGIDVASGYVNVNGAGNSFAAAPSLVVVAGDSIDFVVGGGDGVDTYDSTEVNAVVCIQ